MAEARVGAEAARGAETAAASQEAAAKARLKAAGKEVAWGVVAVVETTAAHASHGPSRGDGT